MMTDHWYIRAVDHRISTAIIFFLLLILIGKKHTRTLYPLRLFTSLLGMCLISWIIRYATDVYLVGPVWQGLGHSLHLLVMSLLFMGAYAFCYQARAAELIYVNLLALTIYKLAWNTFKVFAAGADVAAGCW